MKFKKCKVKEKQINFKKKEFEPDMEVCKLLIPVLWRQRQENLYEIEQVLSQPGLQNETLSQKQLKLKKKIKGFPQY